MYAPSSLRSGKGRDSIRGSVREAVVAARLIVGEDGSQWIAEPQGVGITGCGDYTTAEEALDSCRRILRNEGFLCDYDEAHRLAEAQAASRRHAYDGLPKDLHGTILRLREMRVLSPDQSLSEKWWSRGVNKHRAREAMLGNKHATGLIKRDCLKSE